MRVSRKRTPLKSGSAWSSQSVKRAKVIPQQQQALAALTPKSDTETLALQSQKNLLGDYATVEKQQLVTETRFATTNARQVATTAATAAMTQAERAAANTALLTPENQSNLLSAVKHAVDMWRLQAHFQNITIMGPTAIGAHGCLTGPDLTPLLVSAPGVSAAGGDFKALVNAVADAVSDSFQQWQDFVQVPALPWYPAFTAFPGPMAPPMPNIPMPLITCVSSNQAKLMSSSQLETAIEAELPDELKSTQMDQFLNLLSVRLSVYFTSWLSSQQVMMVMGKGPVPSFAPPYVPVGPVVGGSIIASPGHLIA